MRSHRKLKKPVFSGSNASWDNASNFKHVVHLPLNRATQLLAAFGSLSRVVGTQFSVEVCILG